MSTKGGLSIVLVLILTLAGGALLSGCATPTEDVITQVCFLRPMGRTSEGYAVVLQACQSPEAFSASQR